MQPRALHLLAAALLVAALMPAPALAQAGAGTLRIRPPALTIGVGETGTVDVWLEGGTGYYGVELRLACDPEVAALQVTPRWEAFDAGSHLVLKSQGGWCDDRSGQRWYGAWYAAANVSPAPACSGSGRICTIAITGLAPGTATLHFAAAQGGTDSGDRLQPATVDGEIVVVVVPGTPTPTSTATPTLTAAPSATAASSRLASPAALPAGQTATPLPAAPLPRRTRPPTAAPLASPTATAPASASQDPAPPAGSPSLLTLLLPFLIGASLTAGALRLFRRRRG